MVRPLEWSGPLSGQPFGASAIGVSKCRIYRERTRPARLAAAGRVSRARQWGRVPQCVPGIRGILVVTPRQCPIVPKPLFAGGRPEGARRASVPRVRVDSFHVDNVKMGIDTAGAYAAEKFARIIARRGGASMTR